MDSGIYASSSAAFSSSARVNAPGFGSSHYHTTLPNENGVYACCGKSISVAPPTAGVSRDENRDAYSLANREFAYAGGQREPQRTYAAGQGFAGTAMVYSDRDSLLLTGNLEKRNENPEGNTLSLAFRESSSPVFRKTENIEDRALFLSGGASAKAARVNLPRYTPRRAETIFLRRKQNSSLSQNLIPSNPAPGRKKTGKSDLVGRLIFRQ